MTASKSNGNPPPPDPAAFVELREEMVEQQIARRGIVSPRVLEAMRGVPRHLFVPQHAIGAAYTDQPLPIGEGQTISQPFMVAAMTEALLLRPTDRVLEIGAGCGYQAAVLAVLAARVYTIERNAALAASAAQRLRELGYSNVEVHAGDGTLGWPPAAPFDAILVTAAAPGVPPPLVDQLGAGGRLVIPVGAANVQELIRLTRAGTELTRESLYDCRFVPLVGEHGWEK